jgi:hypothetical protein
MCVSRHARTNAMSMRSSGHEARAPEKRAAPQMAMVDAPLHVEAVTTIRVQYDYRVKKGDVERSVQSDAVKLDLYFVPKTGAWATRDWKKGEDLVVTNLFGNGWLTDYSMNTVLFKENQVWGQWGQSGRETTIVKDLKLWCSTLDPPPPHIHPLCHQVAQATVTFDNIRPSRYNLTVESKPTTANDRYAVLFSAKMEPIYGTTPTDRTQAITGIEKK